MSGINNAITYGCKMLKHCVDGYTNATANERFIKIVLTSEGLMDQTLGEIAARVMIAAIAACLFAYIMSGSVVLATLTGFGMGMASILPIIDSYRDENLLKTFYENVNAKAKDWTNQLKEFLFPSKESAVPPPDTVFLQLGRRIREVYERARREAT